MHAALLFQGRRACQIHLAVACPRASSVGVFLSRVVSRPWSTPSRLQVATWSSGWDVSARMKQSCREWHKPYLTSLAAII